MNTFDLVTTNHSCLDISGASSGLRDERKKGNRVGWCSLRISNNHNQISKIILRLERMTIGKLAASQAHHHLFGGLTCFRCLYNYESVITGNKQKTQDDINEGCWTSRIDDKSVENGRRDPLCLIMKQTQRPKKINATAINNTSSCNLSCPALIQE